MPQLTKQFAIIEKLKSLVKKSTRPFRRRGENMAISEDIARKIQKIPMIKAMPRLKMPLRRLISQLPNSFRSKMTRFFAVPFLIWPILP